MDLTYLWETAWHYMDQRLFSRYPRRLLGHPYHKSFCTPRFDRQLEHWRQSSLHYDYVSTISNLIVKYILWWKIGDMKCSCWENREAEGFWFRLVDNLNTVVKIGIVRTTHNVGNQIPWLWSIFFWILNEVHLESFDKELEGSNLLWDLVCQRTGRSAYRSITPPST